MRMQIWAARYLQKAALKMQSRNTGTRFAWRRKMWPLKVTLPGCWRLRPTHRSETGRNRFCSLNRPLILRILAAAYAEAGRFDEARDTAHQALQAADNQGNVVLSDVLRKEIGLYEARRPYHKEPR